MFLPADGYAGVGAWPDARAYSEVAMGNAQHFARVRKTSKTLRARESTRSVMQRCANPQV